MKTEADCLESCLVDIAKFVQHTVVVHQAVVAQVVFAAAAELDLLGPLVLVQAAQSLTAIQPSTPVAELLVLLARFQLTLTRTTRLGLLATSWIQTHQRSVTKPRPIIRRHLC